MAISFRCPHCQAAIRVRDELAGKGGSCPGCQQKVRVPAAREKVQTRVAVERVAPPLPMEEQSPIAPVLEKKADKLQQVMQGFSGTIKPVRRTIFYRAGVMLVAGAVVILPVLYVALIGLLGWGVYWHATENTAIAGMGSGRGRSVALLAYVAPIVAGLIAVIFMLKPLFARATREHGQISLNRAAQPHLFAFVEEICDTVRAPRPSRIDVAFDINASAGFGSGAFSLVKSDLVLTIGLPLVAGLSLQQFAGVLAHEFGHFSQGAAMRVSWIVRSINMWFARVVYARDQWDDWLVEMSEEIDFRVGWIFYLARVVVFASRGVLWCFMMLSHMLSCWLSRQMEFDADRYEARLAGSRTFQETCLRLHQLQYGVRRFFRTLGSQPSSGNLIRDAISYCDSLDESDQKKIRRTVEKSQTGWFDTHPADSSRIDNALKEKSEGIFQSDLPAEAVFKKFDQLCLSLMNV